MKYANLVSKDGVEIGIKTLSSQVYNDDGTTIGDTMKDFKGSLIRAVNVSIPLNSWTLKSSGYYEATISNANITASSCVEVNLHIDYVDIAATAGILTINKSESGLVRLYSRNAPSSNIIVDLFIKNEVK